MCHEKDVPYGPTISTAVSERSSFCSTDNVAEKSTGKEPELLRGVGVVRPGAVVRVMGRNGSDPVLPQADCSRLAPRSRASTRSAVISSWLTTSG